MVAIIVAGNGGKTSRYGSNGTLWCKPCNRKWNVHTPPLWLAASKWNTHRCNEYSSNVHKKMPNTNCNKTVLCFQSMCGGERPRKDWRGIQRLRWKTANKTNKQDTLIKWIVWSTVMCYALFCEFLSIFITNQPTNKKKYTKLWKFISCHLHCRSAVHVHRWCRFLSKLLRSVSRMPAPATTVFSLTSLMRSHRINVTDDQRACSPIPCNLGQG